MGRACQSHLSQSDLIVDLYPAQACTGVASSPECLVLTGTRTFCRVGGLNPIMDRLGKLIHSKQLDEPGLRVSVSMQPTLA